MSNGEKRTFKRRGKACFFCDNKDVSIDYKNNFLLRPYLTERSKIVPSRISGTCHRHQQAITQAVKRARHAAIIPYSSAQN